MFTYIFLTICFTLICKLLLRRNDYWKNRNVIQVDGTLGRFFFGNRSLAEEYKDIYDAHDQHVGLFLGSTPALLLKSEEDIQAVLAGDFHSFYKRGIIFNKNDLLANNLLMTDDFNHWKLIRQKLSPLFTSAKLKNMFYILEKCAQDFVEVFDDKEMRLKPFNALYTYSTASIGASVFGIEAQCKNTMDSPFIDMSWRAVSPTWKMNMTFLISGTIPYLFNLLKLRFFGEHEDFFIGVVKSVLASRRNDNICREDFIDMCIKIQNNGVMKDPATGFELDPTDELIAAQAFFFFIAGADTTANTMHFALLELSSQQTILKRVHEEIDNLFETGIKELTYNHMEKLQYLDKVLNEVMRRYPSIGAIQRVCTKETVLPHSKVRLNEGTTVIIPVYAIHRDENYYPNPDVFDPERFAPENLWKIKKFSYLPFGEGNRICIGARLARLQVKVGLARLLRKYTLAEQQYKPRFENSVFALRDTKARYDLVPRDV